MKTCPYCAEKIQDAAIVCRYCGRELAPMPAGLASVPTERFNVLLTGVEPNRKIAVIKEIRKGLNIGLKEAKDLADRPSVIATNVSMEDALQWDKVLKEAGGRVEVRDAAEALPESLAAYRPESVAAVGATAPISRSCPHCGMSVPIMEQVCPFCQREIRQGSSAGKWFTRLWGCLPVPLFLIILYLLYLLYGTP